MRVRFELRGTTPLLMHNVRLADPDDVITRKLSKITSKRKKTPDDRKAIAKLEFLGGLYVDESSGRISIPLPNVKKCLIEAGKVNKLGKSVSRAVIFDGFHVPLAYDGPETPEELYALPQFSFKAMVGVQAKKTARTRPHFAQWALVAEAVLVSEALDFDDLRDITKRAGIIEGLGDNRINGFGRFDGRVTEVSA